MEQIADFGYELYWASFDGNLYFSNTRDDTVLRYDPSQKRKAETPYDSNDFSPDGKYLFAPRRTEHGFLLFLREDYRSLSDTQENAVPPLALLRLFPLSWIGPNKLTAYANGERGPARKTSTYILSIDNGELRHSPQPVLCGIGKDKILVIAPDGRLILKRISDLEKINAEDLPENPIWVQPDD